MAHVNLHIGKTADGMYKVSYFMVNGRKLPYHTELSPSNFGDLGACLKGQNVTRVDFINRYLNIVKVRERIAGKLASEPEQRGTLEALKLVDEQIALFGPDSKLEEVQEEELAKGYREIMSALA